MPDPLAFESVTARLSLPLLFSAQAHKEVFHNEALARIDGLTHLAIESETSTPPDVPVDGRCWLVGDTPTGDWSGREGAIAMYQAGQWLFAQPRPGMRLFDLTNRQFAVFSDTWQKAEIIEEPSGGMTVDSEARAAIGALLSALRAAGILPTV